MIKKTFENEINSFTKQIKSLQKEQKREYRNLKISNKMKDTRYYYFKIIIKRNHTFTPKKNLGLDFGYETQSKIQILFSFFELINVFFKYSILRWILNEQYILSFFFKIVNEFFTYFFIFEWILDKMKEFEKDSFKKERNCKEFIHF